MSANSVGGIAPAIAPKYGTTTSIADSTGMAKAEAEAALDAAVEAISGALAGGDKVTLPGFGTFYTKDRPPSTVKHIRTGEVIEIPAMRQADFRVGELLRQAVRKAPRRRGKRAEQP